MTPLTWCLLIPAGALGALARYETGRLMWMRFGLRAPWGVLTVNLVGAFLLGLLTLAAATGYKGLKLGDGMVAAYGLPALLAGFAMAWVSAALAVKWMVAWLNKHGLALFAWWRLVAAALALLLVQGAA